MGINRRYIVIGLIGIIIILLIAIIFLFKKIQEAICKQSKYQSQGFGEYIESFKEFVPNNKNFTFRELLEMGKDFMNGQ